MTAASQRGAQRAAGCFAQSGHSASARRPCRKVRRTCRSPSPPLPRRRRRQIHGSPARRIAAPGGTAAAGRDVGLRPREVSRDGPSARAPMRWIDVAPRRFRPRGAPFNGALGTGCAPRKPHPSRGAGRVDTPFSSGSFEKSKTAEQSRGSVIFHRSRERRFQGRSGRFGSAPASAERAVGDPPSRSLQDPRPVSVSPAHAGEPLSRERPPESDGGGCRAASGRLRALERRWAPAGRAVVMRGTGFAEAIVGKRPTTAQSR